jgi:hypothetical protein
MGLSLLERPRCQFQRIQLETGMNPLYGAWTKNELGALCEQYPAGVPIKDISKTIGRSVDAVYRMAAKLDLERPSVGGRPGTLSAQILKLVARPGGMGTGDIPGKSKAAVGTRAWDLFRTGLIYRRVLGYRNTRYYATQEAADAATPLVKAANPTKVPLKLRPGWGPNDPAVITSNTKVTIAPAPVRSLRTNTHQVF